MYVGTEEEVLSREEVIDLLITRDGDFCFIGKHDFEPDQEKTIDHWYPKAKAYAEGWLTEQVNHIDNLRLACKPHNARKGDRVPIDDVTAPKAPKSDFQARAVKRANRPDLCDTCFSGRILFPGEECPDCGSGPQPATAPRSLTVSPKECDHGAWICWMCYLGFVPRKSAIITVLDGEILE